MVFAGFAEFRTLRMAAAAWRRFEEDIDQMELRPWEERLARQALRAPSMDDKEEREYYATTMDLYAEAAEQHYD